MEPKTRTGAKARHKTFTYSTSADWTGNRNGTARSADKPELRVSSPPEFKGEAGKWTPEDLFVAAVEMCTMTTFMAFATRKGIPIVAYNSDAEGLLEFRDGTYRFTNIVLRPTIVVESESAVAETTQIIADAHQKCLISNSITTTVAIEPTVKVGAK